MNDQTVKAAGKETEKDGKAKDKEAPVIKPAPTALTAPHIAGNVAPSGYTGSPGPAPSGGRSAGARSVASNVDTSVPPPPPLPVTAPARKVAAEPSALYNPWDAPFALFTMADALPANPLPPPPTMTPESFRQVSAGMTRAEVLKLGDPSSRIAMFEDGHMVETFSYRAGGQRFGAAAIAGRSGREDRDEVTAGARGQGSDVRRQAKTTSEAGVEPLNTP